MSAHVMDPKDFLRGLFEAAVARAQPMQALRANLPSPPTGRTVVVGAGKAAAAMAQAIEALWPPEAPLTGLVVTRYGHVPPRPAGLAQRIEVVEAAHPFPDAAGMSASMRISDAVHGLGREDMVLCLMSGGASSLLASPAPGLHLSQKQDITRALLERGAPIEEINCVRKHLSTIKGGRLAAACAPARVVTLAISDVPGDDPATIGSGPTVPGRSTCAEALSVLARYRIKLPAAAQAGLESGAWETPDPDHPIFANNDVRVIAAPWQSLQAAASFAWAHGITPHILGDSLEGESRELGRLHAALALSAAERGAPFTAPCVILSGGETTVTLGQPGSASPPSRGGRAGEFCLGLAMGLRGHPRVCALAADTDGIDGVEDNAGAFVLPDTLARAARSGASLKAHLDRNDSYGFFATLDDLLMTGPTYTNVNDFRAVLIR